MGKRNPAVFNEHCVMCYKYYVLLPTTQFVIEMAMLSNNQIRCIKCTLST